MSVARQRKADMKGAGGDNAGTRQVVKPIGKKVPPKALQPAISASTGVDVAGGGDAGHEEADNALANFFQEVKPEEEVVHDIKKVSLTGGQKFFKLGPEYIDEEFFECTPTPLYQHSVPIFSHDYYLEKPPDELLQITPIRPRTFSALFAFYKDRGPALNWDPALTDVEEDCFFQEVIEFPTTKLAFNIPRQRKKDRVRKRRVKIYRPSGDFVVRTKLFIELVETPTVFLIELLGSLVLEADEENLKETIKKNKRYEHVLHKHKHVELPSDCTQTFGNYMLSSYSDYRIQGTADVGTEVHSYYINEEYKRVASEALKRQIRETDELTAQMLAEKARQEIPTDTEWKSSDEDDDEDSDADEDGTLTKVDVSRYIVDDEDEEIVRQHLLEEASEDEVPMSSGEEEEFEIRVPLEVLYNRRKHRRKHQGLRIYPDVDFSMIAIERVICMNVEQEKQADMRGFVRREEIRHAQEAEAAADVSIAGSTITDLAPQNTADGSSNQPRKSEKVEAEDHHHKRDPSGPPPALKMEAAEITEEDLDRLQAELDADDEALEEDLEGEDGAKQDLERKSAEEAKKVVQEVEEKDEFDLAIDEAQMLMDEGDDVYSIAGGVEHITSSPSELQKKTMAVHKREDDSASEKHGTTEEGDAPQITEVFVAGTGGGAGSIACEWTEEEEKASSQREEEKEARRSADQEPREEQMKLAEAHDSDVDLPPPPPLPPDPTAIIADKKDILADLEDSFPQLVKKQKIATPAEVRAQQEAAAEGEDDISGRSEGDADSRLSDHQAMEEDVDDSSDILTDGDHDFGSKHKSVFDYRRSTIIPHEHIRLKSLEPEGPYLKQFWEFRTKDTWRKEITEIALHPTAQNVIAVSYGTFDFGKQAKEGLVCVWNAKNNLTPERVYRLDSPATTLAFSEFTPYTLAVGTLDGNIVLFDVRESDTQVLGSTLAQEDKHFGPVWVIYWLVEEDSANEAAVSEHMLSLGDDGYLKKWSLSKGMASTDLMKVMRSTLQIPGRREKRNESLITTLSNAYTVCFFPDNTELFLLGTEEGFIHKCTTQYSDHYVSTYVGHTGPVYRINFSVFDSSVFVSCGADWTVRLWKTDHPAPLLTLNTGLRTIFDVACSLYSATVFICCAELHIEVWDLSLNTLEPVLTHSFGAAIGVRKVAYSGLLNSLIIGDNNGGLHIFGLRNFPKPPTGKDAQTEALMEALLPGYKKRMKDSSALELGKDRRASSKKSVMGGLKGNSDSFKADRAKSGGKSKSMKYVE